MFDFRKYTTINSLEQRTRYKADFRTMYEEYMKLYDQHVQISNHFANLEARLEMCRTREDMKGYEVINEKFKKFFKFRQKNLKSFYLNLQAIKEEILKDYSKTKNVHTEFYSMHEKLAHLKKLVADYDEKNLANKIQIENNRNLHNDRHMLAQIPQHSITSNSTLVS